MLAPKSPQFLPSRLPLLALPLLLLLLLATACGAPVEDADSGPTIDVEPGVEVSTEDDVVEPRRANDGLSGILPSDFPGDVPLVLPASLVDYGEENGQPYAEFATAKSRQSVEQGLIGLLQDRDWDVLEHGAEGTPNQIRLVKDQRPLRIVFRESEGGGAVYRVVY